MAVLDAEHHRPRAVALFNIETGLNDQTGHGFNLKGRGFGLHENKHGVTGFHPEDAQGIPAAPQGFLPLTVPARTAQA